MQTNTANFQINSIKKQNTLFIIKVKIARIANFQTKFISLNAFNLLIKFLHDFD